MTSQTIHIEQDAIDTMEPLAQEFLEKVLGMDANCVLLTDLSSLSDFTGEGDLPDGLNRIRETGTRREFCKAWDLWVLQRVQERFEVRCERTTSPMVELLASIENARKLQTVH